jgi:long-chain acyl-CoA synthetase
MPIHQNVREHATRCPEKIAYNCDQESRTYAELASRAERIAAYIAARSRGRQASGLLPRLRSVVVLDVGSRVQFPELFLATTESGSACAVIDAKMPEIQVRIILQKLQPDLVITHSNESLVASVARRFHLEIITLSEMDKEVAKAEVSKPSIATADDDTFLISFTSGTTSQPKAYSRSHATWKKSLERGYQHFGLHAAPSAMCPSSFAYGLALYALCEALHSGGTYYALDKWDANLAAKVLRRNGVQRLTAVPTMITGLAELEAAETYPDVEKVITAGAKMNAQHVADIRRIFPNSEIREYYGASELGFVSTARVYPEELDAPIQTVGTAYPGVRISVLDESGRPQERNLPGIIYVQSDLVCDGYLWGDDGEAFRTDERGSTVGDFGILDTNGALRVLGRQGGMIISGGLNIYPSEVEAALKTIKEVDEAVVLGVDDAYLGARVVAVLSGDKLNADKIVEQASASMPRYKVPREFYVTASWPQTSNGKIARGEVEKRLRDGQYERI